VTIPTVESRDAAAAGDARGARARITVARVVENMVGAAVQGTAGKDLAAEFEIPLLTAGPVASDTRHVVGARARCEVPLRRVRQQMTFGERQLPGDGTLGRRQVSQ